MLNYILVGWQLVEKKEKEIEGRKNITEIPNYFAIAIWAMNGERKPILEMQRVLLS